MNAKAQAELLAALFMYTPLAAIALIGLAHDWDTLVTIVLAVSGALIGGVVLVLIVMATARTSDEVVRVQGL